MEKVMEMNLTIANRTIDKEMDEGNICGYVTDTKSEEQLENYMEEQGFLEVFPFIQKKFDTVAILKNMYVETEKRGKGFGNLLLNHFIRESELKEAQSIVLVADTADRNEFELVSWYERYGFQIVYGNRDSFPVMVKVL